MEGGNEANESGMEYRAEGMARRVGLYPKTLGYLNAGGLWLILFLHLFPFNILYCMFDVRRSSFVEVAGESVGAQVLSPTNCGLDASLFSKYNRLSQQIR